MGFAQTGWRLLLCWVLVSIPVSLLAGHLLARNAKRYPRVGIPAQRRPAPVDVGSPFRVRGRVSGGRALAVTIGSLVVVSTTVGSAAALVGLPGPAQSATAAVVEALSPFTIEREPDPAPSTPSVAGSSPGRSSRPPSPGESGQSPSPTPSAGSPTELAVPTRTGTPDVAVLPVATVDPASPSAGPSPSGSTTPAADPTASPSGDPDPSSSPSPTIEPTPSDPSPTTVEPPPTDPPTVTPSVPAPGDGPVVGQPVIG